MTSNSECSISLKESPDSSSPSPYSSRSSASSQSDTGSSPPWVADPVRILKACRRYYKVQDSSDHDTFITISDYNRLRPRRPTKSSRRSSGEILVNGLNYCLSDLHRAVDGYGNVNIPILDDIICVYFRQIPFHDWVEASVGSRSDAVDNLLMSVALLRLRISQASDQTLKHERKSSGVQSRRYLHPLTQCAIADSASAELPIEVLDFILDPIRNTLAGRNRQHTFLRLMVLSVRFEETYITPTYVDWSETLSQDFPFCEGLVSETPESLARGITEADVDCFDRTTIADLCTEYTNACDERWFWLSSQAYECAILSASLTDSIYRLANRLCDISNYHSMTALIAGVKEAISTRPSCQSEQYLKGYYQFLEPHNNYEYCRRRSIDHEALPWLAPFRGHLRAAIHANKRPEVVSSSANLLLQIMAYSNRVHRTSSAFQQKNCVVLLGDSGVGKSSWISQLRHNEFLEQDDPTIEETHTIISNTAFGPCIADVLDCGGVNTLPALVPRWTQIGEAYVLAYSIASRTTFDRIPLLYDMLCRLRKDRAGPPPVLLLGCKSDLSFRRRIDGVEARALAKKHDWLFTETSAKMGWGLEMSRDMLEMLLTQVLNRRRIFGQ